MNTLGMNFFFNRSTTMVSNVTHSPPPLPPPRTVLPRHLKKLVLYNSLSFRFSPLSSVLSVFLLQLVLLKSSLNRYFFSAALFFPICVFQGQVNLSKQSVPGVTLLIEPYMCSFLQSTFIELLPYASSVINSRDRQVKSNSMHSQDGQSKTTVARISTSL